MVDVPDVSGSPAEASTRDIAVPDASVSAPDVPEVPAADAAAVPSVGGLSADVGAKAADVSADLTAKVVDVSADAEAKVADMSADVAAKVDDIVAKAPQVIFSHSKAQPQLVVNIFWRLLRSMLYYSYSWFMSFLQKSTACTNGHGCTAVFDRVALLFFLQRFSQPSRVYNAMTTCLVKLVHGSKNKNKYLRRRFSRQTRE